MLSFLKAIKLKSPILQRSTPIYLIQFASALFDPFTYYKIQLNNQLSSKWILHSRTAGLPSRIQLVVNANGSPGTDAKTLRMFFSFV